MKTITNIIVKKRKTILISFIILSIISLLISKKVNINNDITEYLPKTSETKKGNDIMKENFKEQKISTLNVMYKNQSEKDKIKTQEKLKEITQTEIKIETKDEYTLYKIEIEEYKNSKIAKDIYKKIKHQKPYAMSGTIDEENKSVLPVSISILSITMATIILIIMSDSYIEPILYLIVIGMAIFINKGTNIIFKNVSNITASITAILQLALSMDYSIILSNRYKQEKQHEKNKEQAMKKALYESFKSITSSSITTIVGLIALVFMSFTIGKDLGYVLAKGVLLSLISIFLCLPGLLLICDNIITKTKKKTINLKLEKLGNYSYKTRYIQPIIIIIILIASYILKSNLKINYTNDEQNKIGKIFKEKNQIAIIYENKYEDIIKNYCEILELNKNLEILCYSNTIGEKLKYNELNKKLENLKINTKIDEKLLKIVYYYYHNNDIKNKMTINEFIKFIKENIKDIDIENLKTLESFTNKENITKSRNIKELSSILDMNQEDIKNILIYKNSKTQNIKMSLNQFITFIKNNPKEINYQNKNELQQLEFFTTNNINKKMKSEELSKIFNVNENIINDILLLYKIETENPKLSINEFSKFTINIKDEYKIDKETLKKLNTIEKLSNPIKYNKENMKQLLELDEKTTTNLYIAYSINNPEGKLTINEFVTYALKIKENKQYEKYYDEKTITKLNQIKNLTTNIELEAEQLSELFNIKITKNDTPINTINNLLKKEVDNTKKQQLEKTKQIIETKQPLTYQELKQYINIEENIIKIIYGLTEYETKTISPKELITFINKNDELIKNIKPEQLNKLEIITKNNKYTYKELSNIIGIDEKITKKIYGLHEYKTTKNELTPKELVDFVITNKEFENIKNNKTNNLELLQKIMNNQSAKYTSKELAHLLNIDSTNIDLLYSLYETQIKEPKISLLELTTFIEENILNNEKYNKNIQEDEKERLKVINLIMQNEINNKTYTKEELHEVLSRLNKIDKNIINLVYIYQGSINNYNNEWTLTLEELINYLNNSIIYDNIFKQVINDNIKNQIIEAKRKITPSKELLVSNKYSRVIINTNYEKEDKNTIKFIENIKKDLNKEGIYIVGDSKMAQEMSQTFNKELTFITILTMIFIFIVVIITFKSFIISTILVLIIECAVYLTMSILSIMGENVYFISLIIVESILMGATIDYAIVYTSYYKEARQNNSIRKSIIKAYNKSINTILTSSSILIIVTLIVANFADRIAAKICETLSEGTICSVILIIFVLPGILATFDKYICKSEI